MNECSLGTHNCHEHAKCIDTKSAFKCQCKPGFTGNGFQATPGMTLAQRREVSCVSYPPRISSVSNLLLGHSNPTLRLAGENFGSETGKLLIDEKKVETSNWTDNEVVVDVDLWAWYYQSAGQHKGTFSNSIATLISHSDWFNKCKFENFSKLKLFRSQNQNRNHLISQQLIVVRKSIL